MLLAPVPFLVNRAIYCDRINSMRLHLSNPAAPFAKLPTPDQIRRELERLAREEERERRQREAQAEYERRFAESQKR